MWIIAVCIYVCSNPFSLRIHLTDAFFLYKRIKNHKLKLTPKGDTWVSKICKFRLWNYMWNIETGLERVQDCCWNGIKNELPKVCFLHYWIHVIIVNLHCPQFTSSNLTTEGVWFNFHPLVCGLMLSAVSFVTQTCNWWW